MLSRCPERLPLAASISFPTSRSVRCSRGLNSAFGRRRGVRLYVLLFPATPRRMPRRPSDRGQTAAT